MFKTLFLLLFLVISSANLLCQTLTGIVYDENKKAIPGASVYFNGTTIGTMTDKNGRYKLSTDNVINSQLIISCLGYQSVAIKNPYEISDIQIDMKPKVIELQEVVVNAKKSKFNRNQYLNLFKLTFLGSSKAGRSCKIKNEEDIILNFDDKTKTLFVTSPKPIIIDNPYLGYLVNFDPVDCRIKIENTTNSRITIPANSHKFELTTTPERIINSNYHFLGAIFFTDMIKTKTGKEILQRRRSAYAGSKMHFFRNFYNNIWNKREFLLYKEADPTNLINPNEYFKIADSSGIKKITVINTDPAMYANKSGNGNEPFSKALYIIYDRWAATKLIFRTSTFLLDKFGYYSPLDSVDFIGEMAKKRIGDWLPVDYKSDK
jgi:hypothetical protein